MSTIHQGTFQVGINDTNGPHFARGKGLKQGVKMAKYMLCFGSVGCNDQAMENPMVRGSGCTSSSVLKTVGPSKRGIA